MSARHSLRASRSLLRLRAVPSTRWAERIFSNAQHDGREQNTASIQRRTLSTTRICRQEPSSASQFAPTASPASDTTSDTASADTPLRSLTDGLLDNQPLLDENEKQVDWARSFYGLSSVPFTPQQSEILQAPVDSEDVEIKPDGIIYLPEIKYRRILNRAFGPGGWGLAPRGETIITSKLVTREYGLVCHGRLVSVARGEQQYFDPDGIPTATEGCKSNALMRCCKDLGIASELWDPRYIRQFMATNARELIVEHATTKKRRKHFIRKDETLKYPWKEIQTPGSPAPSGGLKPISMPGKPAQVSSAKK